MFHICTLKEYFKLCNKTNKIRTQIQITHFYITPNNPQSAYANHIFANTHEYRPTDTTMALLQYRPTDTTMALLQYRPTDTTMALLHYTPTDTTMALLQSAQKGRRMLCFRKLRHSLIPTQYNMIITNKLNYNLPLRHAMHFETS
jgi:hypothetical protein